MAEPKITLEEVERVVRLSPEGGVVPLPMPPPDAVRAWRVRPCRKAGHPPHEGRVGCAGQVRTRSEHANERA